MYRITFLGLFICAAFAAPAAAEGDDLQNYSNVMARCAQDAIPKFDDGVTQANVIAEVIWQKCTGTVGEDVRDRALAGQPALFITSYAGAQKVLFTGYILEHRVSQQ
jgi:hypothetical protein